MRSSILTGLLAALPAASAIQTITAKGNKFFTADGNQFFVKGVAYQLIPQDPFLDAQQCQLDAALMKTLGANAIRSYRVQANGDHSGCMKAFADAGIYMFIDLANPTFNTAIAQESPAWTDAMMASYAAVMDEFIKYDNVAGFFVGNEIVNTPGNGSLAMAYVKASTRDMKAYRDSKGYRKVPIGYSAADIATLRPMLQNYLVCGDPADAIEFFGLNAYEWCGPVDYMTSGYDTLNNMVKDYPIPIFFSETGCNVPTPRSFADQAAIFGPVMSPYWSGAIIYEWLQEENNYGLIHYGNPSAAQGAFVRSGTPTPLQPDFSNLASQWAAATPSSIKEAAYSPNLTPPPCPAPTPGAWEVDASAPLPKIEAAVSSTILGGGMGAPVTAAAAAPASSGSASSGSSARGATTSTTVVSGSSGAGSSSTPSSASAASSAGNGASSGSRELTGMSMGLVSVMLGFVWWL